MSSICHSKEYRLFGAKEQYEKKHDRDIQLRKKGSGKIFVTEEKNDKFSADS